MSEIAEFQQLNRQTVPNHVAIIMDGNGRWANLRGKPRIFGHRAGVESVRRAVSFACEKGVRVLTLFAFSSENWRRPKDEVSGLMDLFSWALTSEVKKLHRNQVKLKVIGDRSVFSESFVKRISDAEKLTENNDGLLLNVAVNYGGRWDIINAVKRICAEMSDKGESFDADVLNEQLVSEHLEAPQDVDLLIRTGGEKRISNFLLWQLAYSEMYVSDVLWPDFNEEVFQKAVEYFASRERRFGCTGEQIRGGKR